MYYYSPSNKRAGDRRVLLPNGPDGRWDAGQIYAASDMLVSPPGHPDEIWLYYGGSTVTHDDSRYRETAIGLAAFRLDGFAAKEAPFFDGWLLSKPNNPEARDMQVNASARPGYIIVEALDEKGHVTASSKKYESTDATRLKIEGPPDSLTRT